MPDIFMGHCNGHGPQALFELVGKSRSTRPNSQSLPKVNLFPSRNIDSAPSLFDWRVCDRKANPPFLTIFGFQVLYRIASTN
jgi:hypothetical protein